MTIKYSCLAGTILDYKHISTLVSSEPITKIFDWLQDVEEDYYCIRVSIPKGIVIMRKANSKGNKLLCQKISTESLSNKLGFKVNPTLFISVIFT